MEKRLGWPMLPRHSWRSQSAQGTESARDFFGPTDLSRARTVTGTQAAGSHFTRTPPPLSNGIESSSEVDEAARETRAEVFHFLTAGGNRGAQGKKKRGLELGERERKVPSPTRKGTRKGESDAKGREIRFHAPKKRKGRK